MSCFRITGGRKLGGTVTVQGAKNSVLPILAASLLTGGESVIRNCPRLTDVDAAVRILEHLGCTTERFGTSLYIDSRLLSRCDIPERLMKEMRSSVIFLGAILSRTGEARLSPPGGCELGPRPIDLHISALRTMGADIITDGDSILCRGADLHGCTITFPFPSVGATENAILAAVSAEGTVILQNAACEPEIWDLQEYLRKAGAHISGAGTPCITIEGRKCGGFVSHRVIPDRIAAATFLSAAAVAGGTVEVRGIGPWWLRTVTEPLAQMGCTVRERQDRVTVTSGGRLSSPGLIRTAPYPGFPTDSQPALMAACLRAKGTTVFSETIFSDRYRHVPGFLRLGANIETSGSIALVRGVERLTAAKLCSADLRGGAAYTVAALGAEGVSEITELHHIDRGYEDLCGSLRSLGANIERMN